MSKYICKSAGIVGAGIQGICIGLQLLKKNIPTTIFDKQDPARMASYGNAGHFSPYAVLQFNRPDILVNIPKMLFSSSGPLALKWNYVPKMLPWIFNFVKNCNTKSMLHTAKYMHQILDLSLDAYDELFKEIDITNLVERKGILYAWTNENLKSRQLEMKVRADLGVKQTAVSKAEISDLEPNLQPIFDNGVLFDYAWHARDPYQISKRLFDLYIKKGGKFIKENVTEVKQKNLQETLIKTQSKDHTFEKSVIACGAFSKQLTDKLGENIPLDTERGYHVHFKGMDHLLNRAVINLDRGFGLTPMNQGMRAVGTVELGGLSNPPSKKRIEYIIRCAKELLPELDKHEDEWLGFRPTLPDFLPVIGPSNKNKNIVYAFGHHHLGWTLGAITGKVVSGIVAEENTNLNLAPYNSSRFN